MTLDEAQAALDAAKANCTEDEDEAAHAEHADELAAAYDAFSLASHEAAGIQRSEIRTTMLPGVGRVVVSHPDMAQIGLVGPGGSEGVSA